jgi:hypothetical protein
VKRVTQKSWRQWTKEEVMQEAAKYKSRKDFERGCVSAYRAAKAMDVYEEACAHMKGNTRWAPEGVAELASQCKTRNDLQKGWPGAYKAAKRWGILDEIFSHVDTKKPNGYWTKERCQEVAMQYEKKAIFQNTEFSAYNAAFKNGWLDEITAHMERNTQWKEFQLIALAGEYETIQAFREAEPNAYMATHRMGVTEEVFAHMTPLHESWTKEKIIALAKQFSHSNEFEKANASAYNLARYNGWLDEATEHMTPACREMWTLEDVKEVAKQYRTRSEFSDGHGGAYAWACNKGLLDEVCSHMEELRKPNGYWTYELLAEEAAKYNSRAEFKRGNDGAYRTAIKQDVIEEISQHMQRPLSDKDAVYIWQAVNEYYNGNPVYKIGITSARLGKQRIIEGAWSSGSKAKLIVMVKVLDKAVEVESELLTFGDNPSYTGFCGSTEFRALSDNELGKALVILRSVCSEEIYSD